ncbi:MAG: helix-turn-helix domain-containing protein [Mycobacterium sp.]
MKSRGVSQSQLAKTLQTAQPSVSKWVRGEVEPPAEIVPAIERWLADAGDEDEKVEPVAGTEAGVKPESKYRAGFYRVALDESAPMASIAIQAIRTKKRKTNEPIWGNFTVHKSLLSYQKVCNSEDCGATWFPEFPMRPGYRFSLDWPELHNRYVTSGLCPKCGSKGVRHKRGGTQIPRLAQQVVYLTSEERQQVDVDLDPSKEPIEVQEKLGDRVVAAGWRNNPKTYKQKDQYQRVTHTPLRDFLTIEYLGESLGEDGQPDQKSIDDRTYRLRSIQSQMKSAQEDMLDAETQEERQEIYKRLDELNAQMSSLFKGGE